MTSETSGYEWRNTSFVDKLKHSYQIIALSYQQLLRLGAVLFVFVGLSVLLIAILSELPNDNVAILLALAPAMIIILSVVTVFSAVIISVRETIETGKTPSWIVSIREGLGRFGAVASATIIYVLFMLALTFVIESVIARIGLSFFMWSSYEDMSVDDLLASAYIPTVFMWSIINVYVGFYLYAVILQKRSGWQSIVYSYELVRGRWLHVWLQTLGLWFCIYLVDRLFRNTVQDLITDVSNIIDDSSVSMVLRFIQTELIDYALIIFFILFYIVFHTIVFISLRDARKHRLATDAGVYGDM